MPSGKKYGKPTYQPASLSDEASSTLSRVEKRLSAITREVMSIVKQAVQKETGEGVESQIEGSEHEGPGLFDFPNGDGFDKYDEEIRQADQSISRDDERTS